MAESLTLGEQVASALCASSRRRSGVKPLATLPRWIGPNATLSVSLQSPGSRSSDDRCRFLTCPSMDETVALMHYHLASPLTTRQLFSEPPTDPLNILSSTTHLHLSRREPSLLQISASRSDDSRGMRAHAVPRLYQHLKLQLAFLCILLLSHTQHVSAKTSGDVAWIQPSKTRGLLKRVVPVLGTGQLCVRLSKSPARISLQC